jgi:hypothetical protein
MAWVDAVQVSSGRTRRSPSRGERTLTLRLRLLSLAVSHPGAQLCHGNSWLYSQMHSTCIASIKRH